MKRAALYCRVSTVDQHPETQLLDLRQFAAQKGFQLGQEIRRSWHLRRESTPPSLGQNDGGCPPP